MVTYGKVDGVFYREAGPKEAPAILLLHGFPTSSHMFRDLIPRLADKLHLIAPDLPAFGQSDPPRANTLRSPAVSAAVAVDLRPGRVFLVCAIICPRSPAAPVGTTRLRRTRRRSPR